MDTILIADRSYQLVARATATRKNTLPKHALEDGSTATDHIIIGQPTLDFNLILFPGEYAILEALSRYQKLFSVVTPQGTYQNVALASISDEYGRTSNTTQCTISLQVQRVTTTQKVPTELGGIVLNPDGTKPGPITIENRPDTATINQLKERYLQMGRKKLGDGWRTDMEAKFAAMDNQKIWDTLMAADAMNQESILAAINIEVSGDYRQAIDWDKPSGNAGALGKKFTMDTNGVTTEYLIRSRTESNPRTGEPMIHAIVTRTSDGEIMYNGKISDMTPFIATDPKTGETLITMQYSEYEKRIYVS